MRFCNFYVIITAGRPSSEKPLDLDKMLVGKNFFLEEKENYYVQTERFYVNRASGGDCHYRIADGDTDAGPAAGEKAGMGH